MTRKLLIALAVVAGLFVVAAIALPLLINADSFRPRVESQLQASLGRKVEIGHLSLSLFSGGVSAEKLDIADDPAFSRSPFLSAKSLDVGVDLSALIFSRELKVNSLTVNKPAVSLIHNAAGKWNFSSLGSQNSKQSSSGGGLTVQKLEIKDATLSVGTPGAKPRVYDKVGLTVTGLSLTSSFPFTAEASTPGGGTLKLSGHAGPINQQDSSATPFDADVTAKGIDLAATGFTDANSGIGGTVDYTGKLNSDGHKLQSQGSVKADKLRLSRTGSPATKPVTVDYSSDYDLKRETGNLTKGDVHLGSSVAHVSGTFDAHGASPVVNMKFTGQALPIQDIAAILPALGVVLPAGSSLQGGTASANLNIVGPATAVVTTGDVNLQNVKLAGFSMGSKMSSFAALAGIKSQADTDVQQLSSKLRIAPEGTRADDINLVVADLGTVTGSGTVGSDNSLNFHLTAKLTNGGGVVGGLTKIAGLNQVNKPIPFYIKGTTAHPEFIPDAAGLMGNTMTAPAQGLGNVLNGLFTKKKKQ